MKRVATAADPIQAHLMRDMLQDHGINAVVQGDALWGARGELPFTEESAPSIWVADEEDAARAKSLIEQFRPKNSPNRCPACGHDLREVDAATCPECGKPLRVTSYWRCPTCGETSETQFTQCWKCETPKPRQPEPVDDEAPDSLEERDLPDPYSAQTELAGYPDCTICGGTGRGERRVVAPAALLVGGLWFWLWAVSKIELTRFPYILWQNFGVALALFMVGTAAMASAFLSRYSPCSCTRRRNRR